jgi:phospholipid/cholesterol/gamma-HCH transport system substrate-binding protein
MDEKVLQFRVGVLVVATVIIAVILVMIFEELPRGLGGRRTVYIYFPSAPGVAVNTPVRKSGILIGRVSDVRLEDSGGVLITARLDVDRVVRKSEICRIRTGNFLGDAMLEFVPSGIEGQSDEPLADGAFLHGDVSRDALGVMSDAMQVFVNLADDLEVAMASVKTAGEDVGDVARNLNVLVVNNQDQFGRIMVKTETALGRFDTTMTAVQELVSDEELRVRWRQILDEVPKVLSDASNTIAGLGRVADEAEQNLIYLQGLTKPLGEQGEEIVSSLQRSLARLDSVLGEVDGLSRAIGQSQGSLGQFLNNPDLYQRLNNAAANLEELTFRLQPVVEDARVISDKLARNPGRLFRGAIGPQVSGLK